MTLRQASEVLDHELPEHDEVDEVAISSPMLAAMFRTVEPAFSALERQVILLARRDPLASLEAPGLVERVVAWAFGLRTGGRRLADPRLEALRRAAVVTRHRHHLPDAVAADLRRLGFGAGRIAGLERLALAG